MTGVKKAMESVPKVALTWDPSLSLHVTVNSQGLSCIVCLYVVFTLACRAVNRVNCLVSKSRVRRLQNVDDWRNLSVSAYRKGKNSARWSITVTSVLIL
jgi:hypothetical protein